MGRGRLLRSIGMGIVLGVVKGVLCAVGLGVFTPIISLGCAAISVIRSKNPLGFLPSLGTSLIFPWMDVQPTDIGKCIFRETVIEGVAAGLRETLARSDAVLRGKRSAASFRYEPSLTVAGHGVWTPAARPDLMNPLKGLDYLEEKKPSYFDTYKNNLDPLGDTKKSYLNPLKGLDYLEEKKPSYFDTYKNNLDPLGDTKKSYLNPLGVY